MSTAIKKEKALNHQDLLDILNVIMRANNFVLNSGGLAIKGASSAVVKTGNAINAVIKGVLIAKAAGDMPALSGTVANGKKAAWIFTIKADGSLTTTASNLDAANLADIVLPQTPDDEALIGFVIVENGTGSNFVGGTTALDTSNLTVTYVNTPFPCNIKGLKDLLA